MLTHGTSGCSSRGTLIRLAQVGVIEVDVQVSRGRREIGRAARSMRSAEVDHGRLGLLRRDLCQAQ